MTRGAPIRQAYEHLDARAIGLAGLAIALAIAGFSLIAWELVRPVRETPTLPPSELVHDLYTPGPIGAGTPAIDREPAIEAAIKAVVADPSLIGGHR